jgi:predicted NBD/HSP70 family sugar kinase/biotin operon repressor
MFPAEFALAVRTSCLTNREAGLLIRSDIEQMALPDMRPQRNVSRRLSERMVVETILQGGEMSRASLSARTGLSKQTVSDIMRDLEREGWVVETGRTSGAVGRSAITYEFVPAAAHVMAADLGGTKVKIGIADLVGDFVAEAVEPTDPRGGQHVVDQISRMCQAAMQDGCLRPGSARLAVIGVPGVPEPASGRVRLAPNIAGLDTMDVAASLERSLGFRVVLSNDTNLATQGEAWRGAGRGVSDLAYVDLGTGVGSGLMISGELVLGADNAAGELGFLPFGADPLEPESLRTGAFERVVAAAGIRNRYTARSGRSASVVEIFDRTRKGDGHAAAVLEETGMLLAAGIAAICAIVNPQKVILGGSIGSRPELIGAVRTALPRCFPAPVEVAAGALGARAALVGAAAVGLGLLHNALFGGDLGAERIPLPTGRSGLASGHSPIKSAVTGAVADRPGAKLRGGPFGPSSPLRGAAAPASAMPGRQR